MSILYLDCGMGAAGDMLSAALFELLSEKEQEQFLVKMNRMGLSGVSFRVEKIQKCGISGSKMRVLVHGQEEGECLPSHEHEHSHAGEHTNENETHHSHHHPHAGEHIHEHSSMQSIEHIIESLEIEDSVRKDALAVYRLIAQAESVAHNQPMEQIHFHEVGSKDAIADVVGVCMLMHQLSVEKVLASPVHVGSGEVRCAHGILPVPAPATAYILRDVPIYGGEIKSELCTPTGAALLKYFVNEFGGMPMMRTKAIGYGMGSKDFPRANCVRAMLGEEMKAHGFPTMTGGETLQEHDDGPDEGRNEIVSDHVLELSANIDDMTAEELGFAMEMLLDQGALDVYTLPLGMKKNRPGSLLNVLCRVEQELEMEKAIFRYTTSLGIRKYPCERAILKRELTEKDTEYGTVRVKRAWGYGVSREKYEYEDLSEIAKREGLNLRQVIEKIKE